MFTKEEMLSVLCNKESTKDQLRSAFWGLESRMYPNRDWSHFTTVAQSVDDPRASFIVMCMIDLHNEDVAELESKVNNMEEVECRLPFGD